ncbi:hypothetical protein BBO_01521 [Beauveria brongniartii RCEF 3172]|uniref:Uncharacterized protein n=1 Tax=Beauveria brongniartii RCEF 3172 TaxID=1081107 RepID=A0A167J7P1_9HYPO|nr:hypothetical protein BBO_01521 [Beauveria brongniartii RCEF 3172]
MKVSTTGFLLASLYGSAWAAPVSGDLVGSALESVTSTGGPGNVAAANDLTGAVGQPGSIVGRDGEQKASVVLPEHTFVATGHTADVDIRADATNVHARNFDAKVKGIAGQLADVGAKAKAQPFAKPPADIKLDALVDGSNADSAADSVTHQTAGTVAHQTTGAVTHQTVDAVANPNVEARNLDAQAKGVVGQLGNDAHAKVHPFTKPPVDVNANVMAVAADHDSAKAADSV